MLIDVTNLLYKCTESWSFGMDFADMIPSAMEWDELATGSLSPLRDGKLQILQFDEDTLEPELSIISIMKELSTPEAQLMRTPVEIEHITSGGIDPRGMPMNGSLRKSDRHTGQQRSKEETAYMAVKKGERRYMSVDILHMSWPYQYVVFTHVEHTHKFTMPLSFHCKLHQ